MKIILMMAVVLSMTACGFWPGNLSNGTRQNGFREEEPQEMTADESEEYKPMEEPTEPAKEDAKAVYDQLSDEKRQELANLILPYLGPFTKGEEGSARYREEDEEPAAKEPELVLLSAKTGPRTEELPKLSFVHVDGDGNCIEVQGAMEFRSQSGDFKGIVQAGFAMNPKEPSGFRLQWMSSKWIPLPISRESSQEDYEYDTGDLSGLFSPLVIYADLIAETADYWEFWAEAMEFSDGGGGGEIMVNTIIRLRKDAQVSYGPVTITAEEYLKGKRGIRILWTLEQDEAGYITRFQDMNAG